MIKISKNIKKLATCAMALMFATSLVACGNNTKPINGGNDKNNTTSLEESNKDTQNSTGQFKSKLLPNTYKVPMRDVVVDMPNYQLISEGFSEIAIVHELKYACFVETEDKNINNPKDAFKPVFRDFKRYLQNYNGGPFKMDIQSERVETINGIETYYFEGMMSYGEEASNPWQCYSVGYTFVYDGTPFGIFGSVIDESQPEDAKKEIKQVVIDMMKTVRNKR